METVEGVFREYSCGEFTMHINVPLRFYINKIYWANIVSGLCLYALQWIDGYWVAMDWC